MTEAKVDFTAHPFPVLAVACPKCGAGVDAYCKRPSGHQGPFVGAHAERNALADAIWERQGDWPIIRTETGWAYAVGQEEDDPPPGSRKRPQPAAAAPKVQGVLL